MLSIVSSNVYLKLVYQRGHPIYVHISLSSASKVALDYLSNPTNLQVCLIRAVNRVKQVDASKDETVHSTHAIHVTLMGVASLWKSADTNKLEYSGEITVDEHLSPSFVFGKPSVQVNLSFFFVMNLHHNALIVFCGAPSVQHTQCQTSR